jgi:hypothetical protein
MDVDRDQNGLRNFPVIGAARVDSATEGHQDPVHGPIIRDILAAHRTAEHVNRVVVAAPESVRPEIADLLPCMAGDVFGEYHLQPAPDFAIFLPGLDLRRRKAGVAVEEGLGEVGP